MNWEYKTFKLSVEGFSASKVDIQNFDAKLNDIAAGGWELVTFSSVVQHQLWLFGTHTGYIIATFKRQKS